MTDTAPLTCRCNRPFRASHDAIRAAVDAGSALLCDWCTAGPTRPPATNDEYVLLAVAQLCRERGADSVPQSPVILRTWQLAPGRFGLEEFEFDHPDVNKIIVLLVQMCGAGWANERSGSLARAARAGTLTRPAPKTYALTPKGVRLAKQLEATCSS